jgi:hypothetical protein
VTIEYLDLADYIAISVEVTGLDVETVMKVTNLDLADSALHAPSAGFGEPTSIRTSSTRLWRSSFDSPPTTRSRRATSALRGWRYGCSST